MSSQKQPIYYQEEANSHFDQMFATKKESMVILTFLNIVFDCM